MSSQTSLNVAILIISETASKDASTDKGVPALRQAFSAHNPALWNIEKSKIVPDNILEIQRAVTQWTDSDSSVNLIVTSGGTGFAQKDVTPEVIAFAAVSCLHPCTDVIMLLDKCRPIG